MIIKQRNFYSGHDSKRETEKQKKENPFGKSNPYRVKAKFYSQKKELPQSQRRYDRQSSTNPQSLRYRRDYRQSPGMFESRQLKDNFLQERNSLLINRNKYRQVEESREDQQYRMRLKQFVADKYCPSDPYLEILKDKFLYYSGENSEFKNAMKMSSLGLSHLGYSRKGTSCTYRDKPNPFYRKNLLSQKQVIELYPYNTKNSLVYKMSEKRQYFPYSPQTSRITQREYFSITPYAISLGESYDLSVSRYLNNSISMPAIDPLNSKLQKLSSMSSEQNKEQFGYKNGQNQGLKDKKMSNGMQNGSFKSLEASFGPDKFNNRMRFYSHVDVIIQHNLEDPLHIQAHAPRTVLINGKVFYLNQVKRHAK